MKDKRNVLPLTEGREKSNVKRNAPFNKTTPPPVNTESYSRGEVIKLLNAYGNHVAMGFIDCECLDVSDFDMTEEEWIKENLKL